MTVESFDPYHKWLGIAPGKRPPTHYELLGIARAETDPEVIRSAAERQRGHVAKFRTGAHQQIADRLLYELDEARLTLLNPEMRRSYDQQVGVVRKRRRGGKAMPLDHLGGLRPVGEESGLTREFLGVMAVVVGGFILMAVVAFMLDWPSKKSEKGNKAAPPAANVAPPNRPIAKPVAEVKPVVEPGPPMEPDEQVAPKDPPPTGSALFDGESLAGWRAFKSENHPERPKVKGVVAVEHHEAPGDWRVQDGAIVGKARSIGFLRTEKAYTDFVLRLQAKIPAGANTGVLFRCPESLDRSLSHVGMEVQLIDEFSPRWSSLEAIQRTGALWNVKGHTLDVLRPRGEWNDVEIRCVGDHVAIAMNGVTTVEADMASEPLLADRPRSGFIAFNLEQSSEADVSFRNIEITELGSE